MSDIDPYAPTSGPNIEEARPVAEDKASEVETPVVETQTAPVTEEPAVPEGSVKEVLGWVGEDPAKAQAALDAETAGEGRKTLIKELNVILEK